MTLPPRAGLKEWVGLVVLVLPGLLVAMDLSILLFAVPALSVELKPSGGQLLWIMDIYGFVLAALLVTMGTLGDRIGRRKLLFCGGAIFGIASLMAAYVNSADMLIAARVLLGIGGATLAPATLSLIRNMFHHDGQRSTAIAIWTAGFAGGSVLGPILGGLILEHAHWGTVFLINVPAMLLLLLVGPLTLPEFRDPQSDRFDLLSAGLSLVAVLGLIYGIKRISAYGLDWIVIAAVIIGLGSGILFARRQRRNNPLLDLGLFRRRAFSVSILTNTLTLFIVGGVTLFTAQYMQTVLGMRPFIAALWGLPVFVGMAAGTMLAPLLVQRIRPAVIIGMGSLFGATGLLLITGAEVTSGIANLVSGLFAMATGFGLVISLTNDLILTSVPAERAGAASALSETGAEFGGALGMAILGSIGLSMVYRGQLMDTLPAGLSSEVTETAGNTVASALAVATELPPELGTAVVNAAKIAFVSGMHTVAVLGAIVSVAAGIVALLLLRTLSARSLASPTKPDVVANSGDPA